MTRDSQERNSRSVGYSPESTIHESRITNHDLAFLLHALRIGARGLGRTWPNPSVGCVIVKNNQVLSFARSADGGRPHAEPQALALAGDAARGATVYATLEPCSHHGVTPPCAQALIDAGVARVVYGAEDVDPRVSGRGAAMLQAAGIQVDKILLPEAARDHRGFFRRVLHGMPHVQMKIATSLDGQIAQPDGAERWITGEKARAHAHMLRAGVDAIITGIGTVLADDPLLNVRLPGLAHPRLIRVICDRKLRLGLEYKLVKTAQIQPTWVITTAEAMERNASHAADLRKAGVVFLVVEEVPPPLGGRLGGGRNNTQSESITAPPQPSPYGGGSLSPHTILKTLGNAGLTRVLVEAGALLCTSFLADKCVDVLHWYRAPIVLGDILEPSGTALGNTGQPAISALHSRLTEAATPEPSATIALGPDRCDSYELASCLPG